MEVIARDLSKMTKGQKLQKVVMLRLFSLSFLYVCVIYAIDGR